MQGPPGLHHVGDGIGHSEANGDFHRPIQAHHIGRQAAPGQVRFHQAGIGGGDAPAVQVAHRQAAVPGHSVTKGRAAESQAEQLGDGGPAVQREVAAGQPHGQHPAAHIDGDVPRPQEDEIHLLLGVADHQLATVAAAGIAGLAHQGHGLFGKSPLVGQGDLEHGNLIPGIVRKV